MKNTNKVKVMIGTGEDVIFVRAGETTKNFRDRYEQKIDKLCKEVEREQKIEKVKRKVLPLFKNRG